jgi:acyl carrier protein
MANNDITREEIDAVFPKVAETMADALGCDLDQVKLDVSLIEGLDAESIDFLDMVFRLERAFKIKIPRGKIIENARGDMPESEFEQKGVLTEAGLAQLRRYLSEIPAERFSNPMKVADIPRLFTPETFCKLVIHAQRAARAPA